MNSSKLDGTVWMSAHKNLSLSISMLEALDSKARKLKYINFKEFCEHNMPDFVAMIDEHTAAKKRKGEPQ